MRTRTRTSGKYMDGSYTRRSLSRSPRSRYHSYSPSPSPVRRDSRGKDCRDNCSPREAYSPHPRDNRRYRSNGLSPSLDGRDRPVSPSNNGHGPPVGGMSPSRSRSRS